MLESIRKYAHNPVFKIVFALLIAAFMISGISSMSFGGGQNYVLKVGNKKITKEEVEERFKQMVLSMGPQAAQMSEEQLAQVGVDRNGVVNSLVQNALVSEEAKDVGIVVGEESVKTQLKKMPVFAGTDGKFSAEKFKLFLEKMQLSEVRLQNDMKNDLQNLILASAITNNTPKNYVVAEEIAKAVKATRDIEIIKIHSSKIEVPAPTEEELKTFYFENSAKYQTPQTRDINYISFPKPKADDKISYDKITKIEDEIAGGSNLAEIGKKFGLKIDSKAGVTNGTTAASKATFAQDAGKLSGLKEDEAGNYFLLEVTKINESKLPDISIVKPKLLTEWKQKKEMDEKIKYSQAVLADLKDAKDFMSYAVAKGLDYEKIDAFSSEDKKYGDDFIMTTFNTPAGAVTGTIDDGKGGYIIAKVNKVNPVAVQKAEVNDAINQGAQIFQEEIFQQYMEYLKKQHPIKEPKQPKQKPNGKGTNANPA